MIKIFSFSSPNPGGRSAAALEKVVFVAGHADILLLERRVLLRMDEERGKEDVGCSRRNDE